jgi:hypothetical protein
MRKTENEVKRLMHEGFYKDIDLGEPEVSEVVKKVAKPTLKKNKDQNLKLKTQ